MVNALNQDEVRSLAAKGVIRIAPQEPAGPTPADRPTGRGRRSDLRKYVSGYVNHPTLKGYIGKEYHRRYMALWRKRKARGTRRCDR